MSRSPTITSLLNGQAMKVALGSTSIDVDARIGAAEAARGGGTAEATADHHDARRGLGAGEKGREQRGS